MTKIRINRFYDINDCINKIIFSVSSLYTAKKYFSYNWISELITNLKLYLYKSNTNIRKDVKSVYQEKN